MSTFSFSLERVLEWRRTRCDLEELKVREICVAIERSQAGIAQFRALRSAAQLQVLGAASLTGLELSGLAAYRRHLEAGESRLQTALQEQERRLAEQRARWVEAQRQSKLIEKLRDRQFAEFEAQQAREMESFAAENFLARWPLHKKPSYRD
jgi:flagellar FliJ protein